LNRYQVKVFHRTDLESFWGEFKGWNPQKRTEFVKKAHAIIRRCTYTAVGASVVKAQLLSTIGKDALKQFGGAYGWCAHTCLIAVGRWCDAHNHKGSVHYVFEAGTQGQSQVELILKSLYAVPDYRAMCRLHGWSFYDKTLMPLQAADAGVYEFCKLIDNELIQHGKRNIRKSARDLFRQHELQYLRDWSIDQMKEWAEVWAPQFTKIAPTGRNTAR